jgi:DNA-binding NtrC family response regulator/tetratricopeptide (TPR) repeat protein
MSELEAKRGLLQDAARHLRIGSALLSDGQNVWLEAVTENVRTALAIISSDYEEGLRRGQRAFALADESGAAAIKRATLSNIGNIFYRMGRFGEAVDYFQRALSCLPTNGERTNGARESLARVCLVQEDLEQAGFQLRKIEDSIRTTADWALYANRHSRITQAELLIRQGRPEQALTACEQAIELAGRTGDAILEVTALLIKVEILITMAETDQASSLLTRAANLLGQSPHEIFALYERVLTCGLAAGQRPTAGVHFSRSKRILVGLHSVPAQLELDRLGRTLRMSAEGGPPAKSACSAIQDVAALMLHAGRPELLATDIIALLVNADCVHAAIAQSRAEDGGIEILAAHQPSSKVQTISRTLTLGTARGRTVEILLSPHQELEATATLNALTLLLGSVRDLEQAYAEREQRSALWPIEEAVLDSPQAIVNGQMRELMRQTQQVARTNVAVLITGESGTGKEILARALHAYSQRAQRPFVPFNCTAVPREMLESQLFGHRRGAFTGADRDNPGVIRGARDGTLFLDEIGELGLDLQPKLLRFLESGEISPLGEPTPFNVDVRIVAATNSSLENLVETGRFREDLFYRLNVVRLPIPALRERRDEIPGLVNHFIVRAAAEFGKGHVQIAEETMEYLILFSWPGNVRQLQNELRRMVAFAEPDSVLPPSALSQDIRRAVPRITARSNGGPELAVALDDKLTPTISRIEREMIKVALRANGGKVEAAARALGISRKGLYLKRQRLGV